MNETKNAIWDVTGNISWNKTFYITDHDTWNETWSITWGDMNTACIVTKNSIKDAINQVMKDE